MLCVRFAKDSTSCRKEFLSKWKCDLTIDRNQNVSCNVLIFSLNESSWTWDLWCWSNCEFFTWSSFSIESEWDCDSALCRIDRLSQRAALSETNCFKKKWYVLFFDVYEMSDELYTLCMRIIFVFSSISLTIILSTLKSIVEYSTFQLSIFIWSLT
jgi:hypothetical protein